MGRPKPMPDVPTTFGQAVRAARTQRRLTLRQAAGDLGIPFGYLSMIELDQRTLEHADVLRERVCKYFGVSWVNSSCESCTRLLGEIQRLRKELAGHS